VHSHPPLLHCHIWINSISSDHSFCKQASSSPVNISFGLHGRHRDKWGQFQGAGLIPFDDIHLLGTVQIAWQELPTVGPLGGVHGTDACSAACGTSRAKHCAAACMHATPALAHSPTVLALFAPPEVDLHTTVY